MEVGLYWKEFFAKIEVGLGKGILCDKYKLD